MPVHSPVKKILSVFDHSDYRYALKAYLQLNSYEVYNARYHDGLAALYADIRPDMTISDYDQANEVISTIRGIDQQAKVICMSPCYERLNIDYFKKLGANGYCAQTIEHKQLLKAIEKVLAGGEYWHDPYMLVC